MHSSFQSDSNGKMNPLAVIGGLWWGILKKKVFKKWTDDDSFYITMVKKSLAAIGKHWHSWCLLLTSRKIWGLCQIFHLKLISE